MGEGITLNHEKWYDKLKTIMIIICCSKLSLVVSVMTDTENKPWNITSFQNSQVSRSFAIIQECDINPDLLYRFPT